MKITREVKKQKAIELMNKLDIYKPYIKGFKDKNSVCFYENFGGFWAYQEPELMAKIKEFEEKHNVLVYAVTHEYLEFGECYDFLYIPDYEEEWDELLYPQGNMFYAYAYLRFAAMTNNKDCAVFSLIPGRLFMTTRTYERNRVRTRLQYSSSFPHDTQRVKFNSLH